MKNKYSLFIQTLILQVLTLLISFSGIKWANAGLDKSNFFIAHHERAHHIHEFIVQQNGSDSLSNLDARKLEQVEKNTADLYSRDDHVFVGDFIESRSKVDFSYHKNYQLERQHFQDHIIHKYLKFGKSIDSPKIIFTAGVMGAGKGHVLRKLDDLGLIRLQDYLWIDSDKIKYELPEMKIYLRFNSETAGTKVHKESGFIQEIILSEALKLNKNIIVDGSLTSLEIHKRIFEFIRSEYPQYKIEIIHVVANLERIQERIQKRGKQTGRFVPLEKVKYAYHQVPKTVEALTPLVSKIVTIYNNEEEEVFDEPLLLHHH